MFDVEQIRRDFPILHREVNGRPLIYLDNSATTQLPEPVLKVMLEQLHTYEANVHRGIHTLSEESTARLENARGQMQRFLGAAHPEEVIEDFLIPSIREFTKPLFSIPTHQFLFNAGQINPKEYMDALQVEPSEFELIKYPERGTCLYRCGNERYLLQVIAPEYRRHSRSEIRDRALL